MALVYPGERSRELFSKRIGFYGDRVNAYFLLDQAATQRAASSLNDSAFMVNRSSVPAPTDFYSQIDI